MYRRVMQYWQLGNDPAMSLKKALFHVYIGRDGRLIRSDMAISSGDTGFDAAGQEAIEKAAPYRPLPKSFRSDCILIKHVFQPKP
jgi:outer membrane biosynthesis protein TonB